MLKKIAERPDTDGSRAPGCTNRADKNSNVITLLTIIIVLL